MIECLSFKPHQKGALQGFAVLILTIALNKKPVPFVLKGFKLFMKDGKRWISLPQEKIEKNGETEYPPLCWLKNKENKDAFIQEGVKAIDKWCAENPQQESTPQVQEVQEVAPKEEEFPF